MTSKGHFLSLSKEKEENTHLLGFILLLVWSCAICFKSKNKVVSHERVLTEGIWESELKGGEEGVIAGII